MTRVEKRIAVVLVNWNAATMTLNCIESLYKTEYQHLSIVVVDNGSQDDSVGLIRRTCSSVVLIQNDQNRGFCAANNQAIDYALRHGFDAILILNNDTVVDREFFHRCVMRMALSQCDIVVPKIYFLACPTHFWFVVGEANLHTGVFSNPFYRKEDKGEVSCTRDMEFASGCCILANAEVFRRIGGLDENFFMYCEDIDWSLRARAAGYRIVLEPEARIYHQVSFSGDKAAKQRRFYMTRNHLWVLRRHSHWHHRLGWLPLVPIRSLYRMAKLIRDGDPMGIGSEVKGLVHGLCGNLPPMPEPMKAQFVERR